MSSYFDSLESLLTEDDDDGLRPVWCLAPAACVVLLLTGALAGVALLPRCRGQACRLTLRIFAWGALAVGFVGLPTAAGRYSLASWHQVPPYHLGLTMAAYLLLFSAPLLALLGLRARSREAEERYQAFRQAARIALMLGLATGVAAGVLCLADLSVPREFRLGCAMLGGSCCLLLLGLHAARVDGAWSFGRAAPQVRERRSASEARIGEEWIETPMGPSGPSFGGGWPFGAHSEDRAGPVMREDSADSRFLMRSSTFGLPSWAGGLQAWGMGAGDAVGPTLKLPSLVSSESGLAEPLLGTSFGSSLGAHDLALPQDAAAPPPPRGADASSSSRSPQAADALDRRVVSHPAASRSAFAPLAAGGALPAAPPSEAAAAAAATANAPVAAVAIPAFATVPRGLGSSQRGALGAAGRRRPSELPPPVLAS